MHRPTVLKLLLVAAAIGCAPAAGAHCSSDGQVCTDTEYFDEQRLRGTVGVHPDRCELLWSMRNKIYWERG
jgi:hypothetical protein